MPVKVISGEKLEPLTVQSHENAIVLAKRFQLSFDDAYIIASACLSGASILLTEDMHNGLVVDALQLQNPFIP